MIAPDPSFAPPFFALQTLTGKGLSVMATHFIPSDTLLFESPPLLLLYTTTGPKPVDILTGFRSLAPVAQKMLLSLCNGLESNHTQDDVVLGIWQCNNFCLDDQGLVSAVFDLPSRLNHACVGGDNCRWQWDSQKQVVQFWTDRDIEVGEELTHCYRPDLRMGTKNRREALMEVYGFCCRCNTCETPEEDDKPGTSTRYAQMD